MPIYEFHCPHCGKRFQSLCSWADRERTTCPNCGGKPEPLMSSFGVHGGSGSDVTPSTPSSGGGCGGCGGGSCSTCH